MNHNTSTDNRSLFQPGDLITEHEAADILKVSVSTLRNWRYRGEGPAFIKLGKRAIRYRVPDVSAFVEQGVRS